jgi:hypothetical protein
MANEVQNTPKKPVSRRFPVAQVSQIARMLDENRVFSGSQAQRIAQRIAGNRGKTGQNGGNRGKRENTQSHK